MACPFDSIPIEFTVISQKPYSLKKKNSYITNLLLYNSKYLFCYSTSLVHYLLSRWIGGQKRISSAAIILTLPCLI